MLIHELDIYYQRQFLVYAHVVNAATFLLAESTNLSQEYWAESLSQIALEIVDKMTDTEVEATVKEAETQCTGSNTVHKIRIKANEN